jgi:hypothetical protein
MQLMSCRKLRGISGSTLHVTGGQSLCLLPPHRRLVRMHRAQGSENLYSSEGQRHQMARPGPCIWPLSTGQARLPPAPHASLAHHPGCHSWKNSARKRRATHVDSECCPQEASCPITWPIILVTTAEKRPQHVPQLAQLPPELASREQSGACPVRDCAPADS